MKFRVWNPRTKEWIDDCWMYQSGKLDHDTILQHHLDQCIIQIYTGLKDKNGKEIYEGDIIKNTYEGEDHAYNAAIGWSTNEDVEWAIFINIKNPNHRYEELKRNFNGLDLYSEYPLMYNHKEVYEVIGNIFENPELLN